MKIFPLLLLICINWACSSRPAADQATSNKQVDTLNIYSESVQDSFFVSIQLPSEYTDSVNKKYPVAFVLDGNFYFPTLAPLVKQYEITGLLPPIILISIGYRNIMEMDSLRTRDYLYPKALPADEVNLSGGAENFLHFINQELLPLVDKKYRTKQVDRTVLGHSFGGYFTLFALLQQVETSNIHFQHIVSASPTLWYHDAYLNKLPSALDNSRLSDSLSIFITAGSLEDKTWTITPIKQLAQRLTKTTNKKISLKHILYTELDHMDTGQLSFIKALQNIYVK